MRTMRPLYKSPSTHWPHSISVVRRMPMSMTSPRIPPSWIRSPGAYHAERDRQAGQAVAIHDQNHRDRRDVPAAGEHLAGAIARIGVLNAPHRRALQEPDDSDDDDKPHQHGDQPAHRRVQ